MYNQPEKIIDSWLVMEYRSGQKKAMALLVKKWHKKFCRLSYSYTKDKDVAKDLAQDSWGVIIKKINTLRDPSQFGSWAMSIVSRKSLDYLRNNKKEINNLKTYYDTANNPMHNDDNQKDNTTILTQLKKQIAALPEGQQLVLTLFYLDEFNIRQIGEILRIPTGTVKSRLYKAREQLKLTLKNENYEK